MSEKRTGQQRSRSASVPVDLLLATGERLQRAGDLAAAEQTYRRILETHPGDERATQLLGAILADRNRLDEAIDLFEAAAPMVGPPSLDTFGFFNNYANVLRRAERLRAAEDILRTLVAAAPRSGNRGTTSVRR